MLCINKSIYSLNHPCSIHYYFIFILINREMKTIKSKKAPRVTECQKEELLRYMKENPDVNHKKFSVKMTAIIYENKWMELSSVLNLLGPPKTVTAWKKVSFIN